MDKRETKDIEDKKPSVSDNTNGQTKQDRVARNLIDVESKIRNTPGTILPDGRVKSGTIKDIRIVSTDSVPSQYPKNISGEKSLVLDLESEDGKTIPVYMEWLEDDGNSSDDNLTYLFDMHQIQSGNISDLYGKRAFVKSDDGYFRLYTPNNPKGVNQSQLSKIIGLVLSSYGLMFLMLYTPLGFTVITSLIFVVLNSVLLPHFIYQDAWYTRSHSDWEGGPLFWSSLSLFPILDTLIIAGYLYTRLKSKFV